jgi:hypothetical protein
VLFLFFYFEIVQAGPELIILLPQLHGCWNYRCVPLCLVPFDLSSVNWFLSQAGEGLWLSEILKGQGPRLESWKTPTSAAVVGDKLFGVHYAGLSRPARGLSGKDIVLWKRIPWRVRGTSSFSGGQKACLGDMEKNLVPEGRGCIHIGPSSLVSPLSSVPMTAMSRWQCLAHSSWADKMQVWASLQVLQSKPCATAGLVGRVKSYVPCAMCPAPWGYSMFEVDGTRNSRWK